MWVLSVDGQAWNLPHIWQTMFPGLASLHCLAEPNWRSVTGNVWSSSVYTEITPDILLWVLWSENYLLENFLVFCHGFIYFLSFLHSFIRVFHATQYVFVFKGCSWWASKATQIKGFLKLLVVITIFGYIAVIY